MILLGRLDPADLPASASISTITLAELSVGPLLSSTDDERAARLAHLTQAEADFDPIPFGGQAARAFGRVAAALRATGRKPAARAYDALIAATAISADLALFTGNPGDFAGIPDLDLHEVPHPDRARP